MYIYVSAVGQDSGELCASFVQDSREFYMRFARDLREIHASFSCLQIYFCRRSIFHESRNVLILKKNSPDVLRLFTEPTYISVSTVSISVINDRLSCHVSVLEAASCNPVATLTADVATH